MTTYTVITAMHNESFKSWQPHPITFAKGVISFYFENSHCPFQNGNHVVEQN